MRYIPILSFYHTNFYASNSSNFLIIISFDILPLSLSLVSLHCSFIFYFLNFNQNSTRKTDTIRPPSPASVLHFLQISSLVKALSVYTTARPPRCSTSMIRTSATPMHPVSKIALLSLTHSLAQLSLAQYEAQQYGEFFPTLTHSFHVNISAASCCSLAFY